MSEACPHCRRFREERDEALEALRQAREQLSGRDPAAAAAALSHALGVSPQQARTLAALATSPVTVVTTEALAEAVFTDDRLNPRTHLGVLVHKLRRKLGFDTIETVWGHGWRLSAASKQKLRALLAEVTP